MIQIKNRFTDEIIKTVDDANLRDADLIGANLRDADLRGANLRDANLRDANLIDANLRDADLRGANLIGADLRNADLRYADLRNADLTNAEIFATGVKTKTIKQISGLHYHVFILDNHIKIGCELYTVDEWRNFNDYEILKMDGKEALRFWRENKKIVMSFYEEAQK